MPPEIALQGGAVGTDFARKRFLPRVDAYVTTHGGRVPSLIPTRRAHVRQPWPAAAPLSGLGYLRNRKRHSEIFMTLLLGLGLAFTVLVLSTISEIPFVCKSETLRLQ